jgi:hypothetical protein
MLRVTQQAFATNNVLVDSTKNKY